MILASRRAAGVAGRQGSPRQRHSAEAGFGWYARWGKRIFDVAAGVTGLVVLAAPLLVIVGVSRAIQGPPVFFTQERVGRHGKRFRLWKLRTMETREEDGNPVTVAGDARVTAWGRFLRRFKLDELPQIVCVLAGSMSLVRPRPDVPGYWDRLEGRHRAVLELRPGITGPATLVFRDEEKLLAQTDDPRAFNDHYLFPEKVRLNTRYAHEMSFLSDLKWIVYTVLPERLLRRRLERQGWTHQLAGKGRVTDLGR